MRKLALAVAVAMASSRVYALGMGEIELHSALNEPLSAEVPLLSVRPGELDNADVRIAPNEAFTRAGIERPAILSDVKFNIVHAKNGASTLEITSTQPIREPFLDFIVQLRWQSGRLLREYTLLLDPPVFGEEKEAPVAAPVAEMRAEPAQPASPVASAPMATAAPTRPAPTATPRQAPQAATVRSGMIKSGATGEMSYGRTRRNDTLWSIASAMRPDESVSVYQMMLALLKENPQAFYDNNINGLKAGYVLRLPEKSEIMAINDAQAMKEAARQNEAWLQSRPVPAAGDEGKMGTSASVKPAGQQASTEGKDNTEKARLRLVAPGDVNAESEGGMQGELARLQGELAIAMESSDTAKRESEELRSRVATLENQINSLQRLLTLKDQALNDLQQRSGMTATQPQESQEPQEKTNTPTMEVPPAAPAKPAPVKPAPVQAPAPKTEKPLDLFANPTLMGAVAGAVLLLLSVLWLIVRRRRAEDAGEPDDNENAESEAIAAPVDDEVQPEQQDGMDISSMGELGMNDSEQMNQVAEEVAQGLEEDISETANDLDVLHTPEGDIDPIVEADVYLAYRRYQQAETLIQNALAKQPGRHDLQAKLLEIYYAAKNRDSFQRVAQSLFEGTGGNPENATWQRILPMGRELCPDNELFSGTANVGGMPGQDAAVDEQAGDSSPVAMDTGFKDDAGVAAGASDEHFDLNLGGAENGDPQAEKMDFDLNIGEESLGGTATAAADMPSGTSAAAGAGANQSSAMGGGIAAADAKGSEGSSGDSGDSWEIEPAMSDFGNVDFGLDDADLLAGTDVVGTKLDLARAYIDMGDNDSARDILTEVIEEGNDQQKQEAKGLVEKIA